METAYPRRLQTSDLFNVAADQRGILYRKYQLQLFRIGIINYYFAKLESVQIRRRRRRKGKC